MASLPPTTIIRKARRMGYLEYLCGHDCGPDRNDIRWTFRSPSQLQHAKFAFTCRESRIETLVSISAEFGDNLGGGKEVYFNFAKDGLASCGPEAASKYFGAEYHSVHLLLPTIDEFKALKHKLEYLIVGELGLYGQLSLTQITFDRCGQPKQIIIAHDGGAVQYHNKFAACIINRLNLTGSRADSAPQGNINGSRASEDTAPTLA
ncbi:hypothetical protein IFR05_008804 [Cadophora sp. M221]|nr:hypothetical protein IFR05_008804 [Cadophora sp. M221]